MDHLKLVTTFYDNMLAHDFLGVHISGYDYNIILFRRRRSYKTIWKNKVIIVYCNLVLYFNPDSKKYNRKLNLSANTLNFEKKFKISLLKKIWLVWLIRWDLILNRCSYVYVRNKKLLVYKDIRKVRL